jgi:hypothetical protein
MASEARPALLLDAQNRQRGLQEIWRAETKKDALADVAAPASSMCERMWIFRAPRL